MRNDPSHDMLELLRQRQGWAGRLVELADHLAPADRTLLRAIYTRGMSAGEFARAIDRKPRSIRKRVHRLVQRITSREYQFILARRSDWPPIRRRVAESIILRGMSQRETAMKHGVSVHRVRRELDHVRAIVEVDADSKESRLTRGVA